MTGSPLLSATGIVKVFDRTRALDGANFELAAGEVLVAAFDGIPEFVDLLKSKAIVASGMQQPYLMGQKSGEALVSAIGGTKPEKEILVPILVVTSDNIDKELPVVKETVFANEV